MVIGHSNGGSSGSAGDDQMAVDTAGACCTAMAVTAVSITVMAMATSVTVSVTAITAVIDAIINNFYG